MLENLRGVVSPRAIQVFLIGAGLAAVIVGGFSLLSSGDGPASQAPDVAGAPGTPRATTTVTTGGTPPPQATAASTSPQATAVPASYTVKAGDSASEIAKAFGVADQDLTAWLRDLGTLNNIDPDRLEVGQVLKLPGGSVSNASASTTAQPSTSSGGTSVPGAPGAPASTTPGPGGSTSPAGPTATSQPGSSGTAVPTATSPAAAATSTPAAPGNQPVATSTTAPPASTATPGPEASIALSPTRVTEGTVMTMTLSNFPPSSTVTVCFVVPDGSQDCGEVDVDANGYFSAPGSPLPADIKEFPGQYRMDALGSDGSVASASFEVY